MAGDMVFTSESVTEGHPDKIADQISDAVLDAVLGQDPLGRVACETLLTTGLIMVAGEITTTATLDVPQIARGVVRVCVTYASTERRPRNSPRSRGEKVVPASPARPCNAAGARSAST